MEFSRLSRGSHQGLLPSAVSWASLKRATLQFVSRPTETGARAEEMWNQPETLRAHRLLALPAPFENLEVSRRNRGCSQSSPQGVDRLGHSSNDMPHKAAANTRSSRAS